MFKLLGLDDLLERIASITAAVWVALMKLFDILVKMFAGLGLYYANTQVMAFYYQIPMGK